jgi:hypothetical protein
VPSTVENRKKDQTSIPSAAAKSKVSPGASNAPATAVLTMPNKPQLKPPTKKGAVVQESGMPLFVPKKGQSSSGEDRRSEACGKRSEGGIRPIKGQNHGDSNR